MKMHCKINHFKSDDLQVKTPFESKKLKGTVKKSLPLSGQASYHRTTCFI